MPRRLAMLAALAIAMALQAAGAVIIDHDGGVDDLVAISLLIKSGRVDVRAVTICPAASYLDSATRATRLFLDRSGAAGVAIAEGHSEGVHPFPPEWRKD